MAKINHPPPALFAWLRLLFGSLFFALSWLTVFPAPTNLLWEISILVTEWGHVLAFLSLLLFLPGWRRSRKNQIAAMLGLLAAILALTPLLRAIPVARRLPTQLQMAFGGIQPPPKTEIVARPQPLIFSDLVRGINSPAVNYNSLAYSRRDEDELKLDFYPPPTATRSAPCVIVVHGGSWRSGDSQQLAPLNSYLAARGYAVASLNYRLTPRWRFPAAHDDVIAAFNFLKSHADSLHLDPQRFVLLGRSAGGHLALLAAYTQHDPAIRGVISFYGPADLHWSYAHPGNPLVIDTHNILHAFLGGSPEQVPANYDAASPLQFVEPSTPPTLLIHGGRDELVSIRQSERLAARLLQAGVPHFLLRLPWATHAGDFNFSGPFGQMSTYAVEYFLKEVTESNKK
ncbi:MAG: Acetyl esterase [bacterium]|nr:Acetyl esterase [bacterium]